MEAVENFIQKIDTNSPFVIQEYKKNLNEYFELNLNNFYLWTESGKKNFSDYFSLEQKNIYKVRKIEPVMIAMNDIRDPYTGSNRSQYRYSFDNVEYETQDDILKLLINCQFLLLLEGDYDLYRKIHTFIEKFNNMGIFGIVEKEDGKILYSNSPVIKSVINETKNDELVDMIARFTSVIATNDDKIGIIKKLSGMIDLKAKNIQDKELTILYNGHTKKYQNPKDFFKIYNNFDKICNNTKINHPEKNNQELTNQDLNITFDLGLSVLRYLENLNNL